MNRTQTTQSTGTRDQEFEALMRRAGFETQEEQDNRAQVMGWGDSPDPDQGPTLEEIEAEQTTIEDLERERNPTVEELEAERDPPIQE